MDKKMLKKIKEILKEAGDSEIKVIEQSADKTRQTITFHYFEKIKHNLASQLTEKQYLGMLANTLTLAIGFMSCVGSKFNGDKELTKDNLNTFNGIFEECLDYIESIEKHECEHCSENKDDKE